MVDWKSIRQLQKICCKANSAKFTPPGFSERVFLALGTEGRLPVQATRQNPRRGVSGWYVYWGEEEPGAPRDFVALDYAEIHLHAPALIPYLALPPGWNITLAPGSLDLWYEPLELAV